MLVCSYSYPTHTKHNQLLLLHRQPPAPQETRRLGKGGKESRKSAQRSTILLASARSPASKPTSAREAKIDVCRSLSRPSLFQTCYWHDPKQLGRAGCSCQNVCLSSHLPICPNCIIWKQLQHCFVGLRLGCFCSGNPAGLKDYFLCIFPLS